MARDKGYRKMTCPIFKSTGLKAKLEKECEACPFSHSCPEDMLDDTIMKILRMIGDFFYERGLEYQRGEHHGRGDVA